MRKVLIYTGAIGIILAITFGLWLPKYQENMRAAAAEAASMAARKDAEDRIREKLKDPDNAAFRETQTFDDGNACGEVNARNSFGGFQGYTSWWITSDGASINKPEDSDIKKACEWAKDPEKRARDLCAAWKGLSDFHKKYKLKDDSGLEADLTKNKCKRFDAP
jgi:hypothetical protein